jgi:hypothetical protein
MHRNLDFADFNRTARSDPEAWEFDSLLGTGYDWHLGNLTAGGFGSLQFIHLSVDPFTESDAGSLNLSVSAIKPVSDSRRQTMPNVSGSFGPTLVFRRLWSGSNSTRYTSNRAQTLSPPIA